MNRHRVCIDARQTRQMSIGMKTYVRELRNRLPHAAPEFEFSFFDSGPRNFGWNEQVSLPLAIRRERPLVSHYLSQYTPALPPRPFVVTIHDLIHLRYPQYFKAKVGPYYQTLVRSACARAARVITDDRRTVGDLERFLGVPPEKVRVVPLGVNESFLSPARPHRAARPYLLYVGNHRPHKDLPTLFRAWEALRDEDGPDLYITGPDDFGGELQRARAERRIAVLGELDEPALAAYYAGALALVHPALCEGFGLPLLEAMGQRCPVIACEDAVPSVLRDSVLRFPAGDASALCELVERVRGDEGLRTALVNQGLERARQLSWDRCARATADVYAELLEEIR